MRRAAAEQRDEGQDGVDDGVRSCALTRVRRPKDELIRFVLGPDGAIVPDLKEKLPGRGVWLTADQDIVAKAAKRNVFARALKTEAKVPEGLAGLVDRLLADAALSALGLANKAGEAVFGHAKDAAEDGCRKLDGKAKGLREGSPIPATRAFSSDELSLASGRTNVIHAALIQGGAARKFLAAAARVERYRNGSNAFANQNGSDTDKE